MATINANYLPQILLELQILQAAKAAPPMELLEDDLAMEIADEYDPMVPNSYEQILNQRKEIEAKKEMEVCTLQSLSFCLMVEQHGSLLSCLR